MTGPPFFLRPTPWHTLYIVSDTVTYINLLPKNIAQNTYLMQDMHAPASTNFIICRGKKDLQFITQRYNKAEPFWCCSDTIAYHMPTYDAPDGDGDGVAELVLLRVTVGERVGV